MEKRVILEKLEEFGFSVEEIPEFGYVFNYEGINFLYTPDNDDEDFLRFSVPNIFDVTEDNRTLVFDIINNTNLKIKYDKVCAYGNNVWATYEHRIFNNDNIEEVSTSLVDSKSSTSLTTITSFSSTAVMKSLELEPK